MRGAEGDIRPYATEQVVATVLGLAQAAPQAVFGIKGWLPLTSNVRPDHTAVLQLHYVVVTLRA